MIKCYHARPKTHESNSEIVAPLIATIQADNAHLEDIWDCCNNSCWWDRADFRLMTDYKDKFKVEFTSDYEGICNDDLIVEMQDKFHVALSHGWTAFSTFEEAFDYCKKHSYWCQPRNYS